MKKQLYIETSKIDLSLSGKVVDKVSLYNGRYSDQREFIMTFKDGTYISLGLECREDEETYLENNSIHSPGAYAYGIPGYLRDGKLILETYIQRQVDLGIIKISEEDEIKRKEILEKQQEEREYQYYLKLKEKYEKN